MMNIGDIGGFASNATPVSSGGDRPSTGSQATQDFLAYMKETPAQKLEDKWLAAHHLTRQQLDAMPPPQRAAIEKQIAAEIKEQLKQQVTASNKDRKQAVAG